MVSVTEIQKKNELSKELKEHGFAADFGDAIEQAEKIYNKKKKSPDVEFSEESEAEVQQQPEAHEKIEELKQRIHSLERDKKMSKRRVKEREETISELRDKINEIVKSINMIEKNQEGFQSQLKEVKKGVSSGSQESDSSERSEPEPQQSQPEQEPTPDNTQNLNEPVDQTGVPPSEVSVDKIFYSGTD